MSAPEMRKLAAHFPAPKEIVSIIVTATGQITYARNLTTGENSGSQFVATRVIAQLALL